MENSRGKSIVIYEVDIAAPVAGIVISIYISGDGHYIIQVGPFSAFYGYCCNCEEMQLFVFTALFSPYLSFLLGQV